MIVPPRVNLLRVLFTLKGSIVKRIAGRCLLVTALAALIVLVEQRYPALFYPVSATPFTLLGLSLSIFMSFRNTACYDRWWEGRKAWGRLLIETRSFVRESVSIAEPQARADVLRSLCGFAHALNAGLRGEDPARAATAWLPPQARPSAHNLCDGILQTVGERCSQLAQQGQISEWRYTLLEQRLVGLSDVQATCERLKHTPLPFPYTLLLHRTIYIFCLLLPFALAEPLGWLAPVFTLLVSYTFFGLDAIGNELEDPFGHEENDLATDALVRTLERDILAALGQTPLPEPLTPRGHVLS
ncbi:bestrophin [Pseudomonas entomophila]|uniref:bestrophin family protein n=1 Tax=Pseudomonas entomophila TaxID=312306 RepID=UPI0015E32857|nr:bestrophin family protein [Pseudomonas entomophila]MBA1195115.1 bestrophin [Pseudomonas entomophila]